MSPERVSVAVTGKSTMHASGATVPSAGSSARRTVSTSPGLALAGASMTSFARSSSAMVSVARALPVVAFVAVNVTVSSGSSRRSSSTASVVDACVSPGASTSVVDPSVQSSPATAAPAAARVTVCAVAKVRSPVSKVSVTCVSVPSATEAFESLSVTAGSSSLNASTSLPSGSCIFVPAGGA